MTTDAEATKDKAEPKKAPAAAKKKGPDVASLTRAMLNKSVNLKPIDHAPSTMPHVPSGTIVVDNLIGGSRSQDGKGQVCPGYPRRKITEIYGPESSGKTTLALAAVAGVQRQGGTVMYLDFEHALHHGYAKQIGVKFDSTFILIAPETLEDGLKAMYIGLMTGVDLIVVDSVAFMVPKAEFEKKIDETAKIGAVAKKLSENLPKFALWLMKFPQEGTGENKKTRKDHPGTAIVLLNQERATISAGGSHGGPETNTAGGKALKYIAYVRLRLSRISSEMIERKDPITGKKKKFPYGNMTSVRMIKSKADAKQGHSANIFIRYGYGVDDVYSIIESGIATGIVVRDGAYYSYGSERVQSRDKFRAYLLANPKLLAEVRSKVVQAIIDNAPQAVSDEELSDEDEISAQVEAEFGDDDDDEGGGTTTTEDIVEAEDVAAELDALTEEKGAAEAG
jgi:recombination protein RecA